MKPQANQSIEPTRGGRFCQFAFVAVAHATFFPLLMKAMPPRDFMTIHYFRSFTTMGISLAWPLVLGWLLIRSSRAVAGKNA